MGAESPAGELAAALGTGGDTGAALPVALDAGLAEVVHAVQHDRLAEELAADGTGQLLPQAPVLAPAGHPCWHTGPTMTFLPPPPPNPLCSGLGQSSPLPTLGALGQGLGTGPWAGPAQVPHGVYPALESPKRVGITVKPQQTVSPFAE